jgi:hypothetical protein
LPVKIEDVSWRDFKKISLFCMINKTLTLIGTREGTFHPLSFLDQDLLAEFLSKNLKLFWR